MEVKAKRNLSPSRDTKFRAYLSDVISWHGYVRFLGMPSFQTNPDVPIEELYVPLGLSDRKLSPEDNPRLWKLLDPVSTLASDKRLVVLGDPGSGKSTLINWFAWYLAAGLTVSLPGEIHGLLPVPIVLRDLQLELVRNFNDLIDAFLRRPIATSLRSDLAAFSKCFQDGKVLLLVDGLDEVPMETRRRVQHALRECSETYPDVRVLCTSRIVGYEDAPLEPMSEHDSGKTEKTSAGLFRLCYVAPFTDDQIARFALNWYRDQGGPDIDSRLLRDAFVEAIGSTQSTLRLARTPNLLTMMALVYRVRAQLPNGRALLYEDIAQAYLESIDNARRLKDPFPWQRKKRWLARVGFEMQLRRGDQVSLGSRSSTELLVEKEQVLRWVRDAMVVSGDDSQSGDYAVSYLDWIARRSGLLLPRGEGLFAFLHLSFQEYFAAVYIKQQIENPEWHSTSTWDEDTTLDRRVSRTALMEWANSPAWHQTFVFLFELLAGQPGWNRILLQTVFPTGWIKGVKESWEAQFQSNDWPLMTKRLPPRANLWTQVLANPHSGLSTKQRQAELTAAIELAVEEQHLIAKLDPASFRYGSKATLLGDLLASGAEREEVFAQVAQRQCHALTLENPSPVGLPELCSNLPLTHLWIRAANQTYPHLGDLQRLRTLGLEELQLKEYSWIGGLGDLQNALLSCPDLADISFLNRCRRLEILSLSGSPIAEASSLASLSALRELTLDYTRVHDLGPISSLPLTELSLFNFQGQSIDPLKSVSSLKTLWISGEKVRDLSPIQSLGRLRRLGMYNFKMPDLTPIAPLTKLDTLFLGGSSIADLRAIAKFRQLTQLTISRVPIRTLADFGEKPKLRRLGLDGNGCRDFSWLSTVPTLEELTIEDNEVESYQPIAQLENLRVLRLSNAGIAVGDWVKKLPKLTSLVVDGVRLI
jgi:Leucine-rich repeat (LRR) protein